jgi:ABC-type amino acid transport substrate-binding protein
LGGAEARALAPISGPDAYVGANAARCLRDVAQGRADAAVSLAYSADAALAGSVDPATVGEVYALAFTAPLRATAARGDDEAGAVIAALDAGLARLRVEGRWFDALAEGLDASPLVDAPPLAERPD